MSKKLIEPRDVVLARNNAASALVSRVSASRPSAGPIAAPAVAQPQGDYRYQGGGYGQGGLNLQGLSVKEAKWQLDDAGYSAARSIKVNGQQYDLWSNSRSRPVSWVARRPSRGSYRGTARH